MADKKEDIEKKTTAKKKSEPAKKAGVKKTAAKAASGKTTVKKTSTAKSEPKKTQAKAAPKKAATARKKSAEAAPAKKTPAKKAPKKSTAAKKKSTKAAPVKKAPAKKTADKLAAAAARKPAAAPKPKTKKAPKKAPDGKYVPRLKVLFRDTVVEQLREKFGYKNINMVPRLDKICLNTGVGKAKESMQDLENAIEDMITVTGQKAVVTKAKQSISNFKLRAGDPVGARITLRGNRLYEFLDRLITIAIPRVRDFNGLRRKSFDGNGNYSMAVKEQIIFPEIDYDKIDKIRGFDITIVTTAKNDEEGYELLKALGMPFRQSVQGAR